MNELAKLCPVQFIEGFNENEEPTSGRFLKWGNYGIAIPYTPSLTYNLVRVEIFGSQEHLPEKKEHSVRFYTDHKGNPSNNCLVDGKLIIPSDNGEHWLPIELAQTITVFAKHKYWFSVEEHPLMFTIGRAEDGEELSLMGNPSGQWVSSGTGWRCMLKFFGRVLPTN